MAAPPFTAPDPRHGGPDAGSDWAENGTDDYVFLDMTMPVSICPDRGVTGRAAPGALDIFTWTSAHLPGRRDFACSRLLARDSSAQAVENPPLTFTTRPDGVEDRRLVSDVPRWRHALDLLLQRTPCAAPGWSCSSIQGLVD